MTPTRNSFSVAAVIAVICVGQASAQLPLTAEVAASINQKCPNELVLLQAKVPADAPGTNAESMVATWARVDPSDYEAKTMGERALVMASALDATAWVADGKGSWRAAPEDRVVPGADWFVAAVQLYDCLTARDGQSAGLATNSSFDCLAKVGRELEGSLAAASPIDEIAAVFDLAAERCRRGL